MAFAMTGGCPCFGYKSISAILLNILSQATVASSYCNGCKDPAENFNQDQDQRLLWHTEPTYCRGQDWLRYRGRKFGQRPGRLSLTLAWHLLLQSLRDPWVNPRPSWEPHQSDARQTDWDRCQINQISNILKWIQRMQILIKLEANIDTS